MIKAVVGLGNPGEKFQYTRHNIGFRVLDTLAEKHNLPFTHYDEMLLADTILGGSRVLLIKPQTFMNNSGNIVPFLKKKGVKPEEMLVVHDELEFPFGKLRFRKGGSARGHNGLKSIISRCGDNFWRLRFGIGRPDEKSQVPDYVLEPFSESEDEIKHLIKKAVEMIEKIIYEKGLENENKS